MNQTTEQPKCTEATAERSWFMLHLGRLSGMNDQMLERAKLIDAEIDAKKAASMLEELEDNTKRYVANAASLQAYAMMWKRAAKAEAGAVDAEG